VSSLCVRPALLDCLLSVEPMLDPWGDWAPITFAAGYLRVSLGRARTATATWMREKVGPSGWTERSATSRFPEVLRLLEPLVMIGRKRELLIECRRGWTAYFDNSARGTDASSAVGHLCTQLACDGIAISNTPHTARGREGIAGSVIL
jgi:hypothetical protein